MADRIFKLAKDAEEKDLAYRLRYEVYCIEEKFIEINEEKTEKDEFDEFAQHFLAYKGEEVVGTVRLIEENSYFKNLSYGLHVEKLFSFSDFERKNKYKFAESSRSSVKKKYRKGLYIWGLWKAMIQYSLKKNITHLIFSANPETNDINYAQKMYCLAKKKGMIHEDISVKLKDDSIGSDIEDIIDRETVCFPELIQVYLKLGCKFIGPASYYPKVGMCALPMVLDLHNIDEPFRTRFLKKDKSIHI
ncbi:GNAT family N-acetyltransferase [Candidatus Woesearchaeota archaeon]|nr:GNAT family N-acetyltransferase [Candidatus Woesearchaeota archaeon]